MNKRLPGVRGGLFFCNGLDKLLRKFPLDIELKDDLKSELIEVDTEGAANNF